ncbi:MAG TPA: baseplate J/gp47 family protein [Longimicrobiaceae bacterium]
MTFRRRTFPEVLDNLLTDVAGGVAAESHPFPPPGASAPPFRHSLEQPPVAQVTSLYGSRDGQPRQFRRDVDFALLPDGQTLEWLGGAELPDPGTLIHINYLPAAAQPVLTDLQTGSVVRTLAESLALEIARLHAQLEAVYRSAFIDTADGLSLDGVVGLLGVERVTAGHAAGEIELTRAAGTRGAITVPTGTRVMDAAGEVEYETTQAVTLAEGQTRIRVGARDLERNEPVPADTLTVLPVPISGIASVTNPAPTAIATQDETDGELRTRARNFLHGSERATLGALKHAIARQQISADVEEHATPGVIQVRPHADVLAPELEQRLLTAIEDARPAGVRVELLGTLAPRRVSLEMRLTTASGAPEQDLRAAQRAVRAGVEDYFARLPVGQAGSINKLVGLILAVPGVEDVRLLHAHIEGEAEELLDTAAGIIDIAGFPTILGELQIADPSLPSLLTAVVRYPEASDPPDSPAIGAALDAALAYLSSIAATDPPAAEALRTVSYGKLLRAVPLPGKAGATLESFDAAPAGTIDLPTLASVAPYAPTFTITLESGLTRVLAGDADSYVMTPFERLALAGVEIAAEPA